jgi:hypothetical protein
MNRLTAHLVLATACLLAALAATPALADTISLEFTGLNLKFAGGQIYDADHLAGGNGNYLEADNLTAVVFYQDSNKVGSLTSDVYADILVQGVPALPPGVAQASGPAVVDLLSSTGMLLHLPFDSLSVSYAKDFAPQFDYVVLSGVVSGTITQNLPFGWSISPNDEVVVQLNGDPALSNTAFDAQNRLSGFESIGTGQVIAQTVPEPGPLALWLSLAATVAAACARRRR